MYQVIDEKDIQSFLTKDDLQEIFEIILKESKNPNAIPCTLGYIFLDELELINKKIAIKFSSEDFGVYMDIRILQIVIYDEIPDFILDDYNEIKRKIELENKKNDVKKFFDWFIDWLKPKCNDISVFISVPNELQPISDDGKELGSEVLILDLFEKINQKLDAKIYLNEILQKLDELGLTIYAKPAPRHKHIISQEHKNKITIDYLTSYYKKFGFENTNSDYLKRKPKSNEK